MNARLLIVTFFATTAIFSLFVITQSVYAFIATSTNFTVYQVISGASAGYGGAWSTSSSFSEVGDNEAVTGSSTASGLFNLYSGMLWDIVGEINAASSTGPTFTFLVDSPTESFPNLNPGTLVATTSILSIKTNNSTGYNVTVARNDSSGTMSNSGTYINDKKNWVVPSNCSDAGDLYETDLGGARVQEMTNSGTFIRSITDTNGNDTFGNIYASVLDSSNNLWVVNASQNRVEEFTSTGTFVASTSGSGAPATFSNPTNVAFDPSGNIWVSDAGHNVIDEFNSSLSYIKQFNGSSQGGSAFFIPYGMTFDNNGNLWVANLYGPIQEFSTSGSGTYLGQITGPTGGGSTFGAPNSIAGIAFDPSGNIWVSLDTANVVEELTSTGQFILSLSGTEGGGSAFNQPKNIRFDSSGNLYVVSQSSNDIHEYTSKGVSIQDITAPTSGGAGFSEPQDVAVTYRGSATASSTSEQSLQFRVKSSGTTAQAYCSNWWGSDDTTNGARFAGFPSTAQKIVSSNSATVGTSTAIVLYNLDVPVTQQTGTYTGSVTYTATVGP